MNCLFLTLSLFVIHSSADVRRDPMCPYPSDVETYYPDPYDCTKYYECYAGEKYVMQCGAGLFWNDQAKNCDYEDNVNCSPIPEPPEPSTTSTTPGSTTSPNYTPDPSCPYPSEEITWGYIPGNCTAYYECDHGRRYEFNCKPGLEWNHVRNYCDYPENVDCSRGSSTPSGNTTSTPDFTPDPSCPYPSEEITWGYIPGNCTAYYECDHGRRYEFICQNGWEWNHIHNYCDYPENVDCSRSTTTTQSTIPTTFDPRCSGQSDGTLIPNEHDCSKYYECDIGKAVSMDCPPGTEFDPIRKICDYPQNSHCTPKFYL